MFQPGHVNGEAVLLGGIAKNTNLEDKQTPGSFTIPIEDDREIYNICAPQMRVGAKRGNRFGFMLNYPI